MGQNILSSALITRVDVDSGDICRRVRYDSVGHVEVSDVAVAATAEDVQLAAVAPDVVALVEAVELGGRVGDGDGRADPGGPRHSENDGNLDEQI